MGILDPVDEAKHHHAWLEWIGLEDPPPAADTWVPVIEGLPLDDRAASSSLIAVRLVSEMRTAGIEAQQRMYEFYNVNPGVHCPGTGVVKCSAVGVHERDLARAVDVAKAVQHEMDEHPSEFTAPDAVSDEELTRAALEAGPPPPV